MTKKNSQRISILRPLFLRYNNIPENHMLLFLILFFHVFFFFLHFFSCRNSRTRQINRDHYGSTPYHSSHVRLEKKVDIRWVGKMAWKELFWGSSYRIYSCPLWDSAKLKTSDCVVILSKITSCQSKGYYTRGSSTFFGWLVMDKMNRQIIIYLLKCFLQMSIQFASSI